MLVNKKSQHYFGFVYLTLTVIITSSMCYKDGKSENIHAVEFLNFKMVAAGFSYVESVLNRRSII